MAHGTPRWGALSVRELQTAPKFLGCRCSVKALRNAESRMGRYAGSVLEVRLRIRRSIVVRGVHAICPVRCMLERMLWNRSEYSGRGDGGWEGTIPSPGHVLGVGWRLPRRCCRFGGCCFLLSALGCVLWRRAAGLCKVEELCFCRGKLRKALPVIFSVSNPTFRQPVRLHPAWDVMSTF